MSELLFGPPPFLSMVVGAKHSGKSELIRFVCYQYAQLFNYVVVIAPTSLNGFYQKFLPEAHIHSDYSPDLVQGILDKQEKLKKSGRTVNCLLIMDDILASSTIDFEKRKSNELNKIWSANRHYNLSAIVVTQKLKGLPKSLRENCDYATIHRVMRSAHDELHETFGDRDRKAFAAFIEEHTSDYKIILYKSNVRRATDHFSVFKIPSAFLERKFKLVY